MKDVDLEWDMAAGEGMLQVRYTVHNRTSRPIWLVDDIVMWSKTAFERRPEKVIVRNGEAPGEVSFYRGMLYIPSREMRRYPAPGAREVPARGKLGGAFEVPVPLKAWHYYHARKMEPLAGVPSRAVLEVQIIDVPGEDKDWGTIELKDGSIMRFPGVRFLDQNGKLLRGEARPLPSD